MRKMSKRSRIVFLGAMIVSFGFSGSVVQLPSACGESKEVPQGSLQKVVFPQKQADPGMETIVTTLNKTLEENRKLLSEFNALQEQVRRLILENNVLKAQIIEAKQGQYQLRDEERRKREEADLKVSDLEKKVQSLEEDNIYLIRENDQAGVEFSALKTENEKMKQMVAAAVPQEEREAITLMMDNITKDSPPANAAVQGEDAEISRKVNEELGALYYSLGNMLFMNEDYKGAIEKYKKALDMNPKDPWAHYNLAVIYDFYVNDDPSAIEQYKKYLELSPQESDANKVRERLADMRLMKEVIPAQPMKADFEAHYKKYQ